MRESQAQIEYWAHMLDEAITPENIKSKIKWGFSPVLVYVPKHSRKVGRVDFKKPTVKEKDYYVNTWLKVPGRRPVKNEMYQDDVDQLMILHGYVIAKFKDDDGKLRYKVYDPESNGCIKISPITTAEWNELSSDVRYDLYEDVRKYLVFFIMTHERMMGGPVDVTNDEDIERAIEKLLEMSRDGSPLMGITDDEKDLIEFFANAIYGSSAYGKYALENAEKQAFYAGWVYQRGNPENYQTFTGDKKEDVDAQIRKWLADNRLEDYVKIPPVEYIYEPESSCFMPRSSNTIDALVGDEPPYRPWARLRIKPRTPAALKEFRRRIADPVYRHNIRRGWNDYNKSGRRAELDARKTDPERLESEFRSKLRREFRDGVSLAFFPELFNAWKNGPTKKDREAAHDQLAAALDLTGEYTVGSQPVGIDMPKFRKFCDDYAEKMLKDAQLSLERAQNSGDADEIGRAQHELRIASAVSDEIRKNGRNTLATTLDDGSVNECVYVPEWMRRLF